MSRKFKGIDIDAKLRRIVPHIGVAAEYGEALQELQVVWNSLSLLSQLSGTEIAMSDTRLAFSELATDLLNQLGTEALNKCLQEASAKAQFAINILIRNLFERTADIGFLCCDEDIRAYLRSSPATGEHSGGLAALRHRFDEYVRKYSVYADVILLDPSGNVLARLKEGKNPTASADPIVRQAIQTEAAYAERFGESDLFPDAKNAQIFAFRVADESGSVLGVLCLVFRFDDEMELIFSKLLAADDWTVVTILDAAGVVIASSDPIHIPVGAKLMPILDAEYKIVKFGSLEYIATSRAAQPYQGYHGPDWCGHAMVPLQHAFDEEKSSTHPNIDTGGMTETISASELFSETLRNIPSKARRILRDLNRSVWNGSVSKSGMENGDAAGFAKTLLKEISTTGVRTKDIFDASIENLHQTVITSLLHSNQSQAALAIDIMDRNLYERANDCRWWAVNPIFAKLLAQDRCTEDDAKTIGAILREINQLYTVYTDLIVFDRAGKVVAVSNEGKGDLANTVLDEEWVARILALRDSQGYAVSRFAPTPLYGDRPTYIYGAAIRTGEQQTASGGVAIVFDAEPQLATMLRDALPHDSAGEIKRGAFSVFVEPGGRVVACSDERFHPGDALTIDESLTRLAAASSGSGIAAIGGTYYAVGAKASSGYREYKSPADEYKNDLVAIIFTPLCDVQAKATKLPLRNLSIRSDQALAGAKEDLATFFVGGRCFAVRTSEIIETIDGSKIVGLPFMPSGMIGCITYQGSSLPVLDVTPAMQRSEEAANIEHGTREIVVMNSTDDNRFGLLVHDLGEVVEVLTKRLSPLPPVNAVQQALADAAITPDDADDGHLVLVLSADRLYTNLSIGAGA